MNKKILYIELGENIRKLRSKKGWTQHELAAELGFTRTSITNIESGLQKTTLIKVLQIACALGCESWDDILPKFSRQLDIEISDDLFQRAMEIAKAEALEAAGCEY